MHLPNKHAIIIQVLFNWLLHTKRNHCLQNKLWGMCCGFFIPNIPNTSLKYNLKQEKTPLRFTTVFNKLHCPIKLFACSETFNRAATLQFWLFQNKKNKMEQDYILQCCIQNCLLKKNLFQILRSVKSSTSVYRERRSCTIRTVMSA